MKEYFEGWSWKEILLSPIYYYQANQVKHQTMVLPTPPTDKNGSVALKNCANTALDKPLTILLLGDSAAAGVGVENQSDALLGQFIKTLSKNKLVTHTYNQIQWQMAAVSGFTSFDLLRQLYVMPSSKADLVIINVGVNDIVKNTKIADWQANLQAIIEVVQRKFFAKDIIFLGLPPMQRMPALPKPLNQFIGKNAGCTITRNYLYLSIEHQKFRYTNSLSNYQICKR